MNCGRGDRFQKDARLHVAAVEASRQHTTSGEQTYPMIKLVIAVPYLTTLLLLVFYGLHRSQLVWMLWKHRAQLPPAPPRQLPEGELPHVTVQLPLFNEPDVLERLLECVARIDYPRERFEIQVLDDSTDDTRERSKAKVAELVRRGVDAVYIHRTDRTGYKAGALDNGMKYAKGSLIAVFDADFLPQPSFLRTVVHHFAEPKVGCVQARWGHLNRETSTLTRVQALMLDGHHMVENRARFAAGRFFNFSGTGGIWRREAIKAAGGWQHDTLTEDLDLSYRAQLAGWQFVYREDHVTPAELPEEMEAFRAQQFRWAKGTVQTARKLLARVWQRKDLPFGVRSEAIFHMTPHFAYPLMVLLAVLLLPMLIVMPASDPVALLLVDIPLMVGSTGSLATFYIVAERSQGRTALGALKRLPWLLAIGAGMSPYLTRAVWEGIFAETGEFVRTPKKGQSARPGRYTARTILPVFELLLTLESAASVYAAVATRHYIATPFAMIFVMGFGFVSFSVIRERMANLAAMRRLAHETPAKGTAAAEATGSVTA
jgi:cellulose synthase/poly-beta-1,6-N-acetylglucosamine synthase-like glycosyltransferase